MGVFLVFMNLSIGFKYISFEIEIDAFCNYYNDKTKLFYLDCNAWFSIKIYIKVESDSKVIWFQVFQ